MIVLRPINRDNWETAARLRVRDDQADFIMANALSIAESKFYDELRPTAIYNGGTMVGFLSYGVDPQDNQYWLYRFMIDASHQRQGYGRKALIRLIDQLQQPPAASLLNVGYHRDNTAAERLYLSVGFHKTGIAPWGELTARFDLSSPVLR